jgi:hypothetical protein
MIRMRFALALCLAAGLSACGGNDEADTAGADSAAIADSATPMAGMPGMPGMAASDTTAAAQMEAHMQAMESANADSLPTMLPEHRQAVANMIAHMNQEMRDMSMQADAGWTATVDSLRQDLRRMPEMGGAELKAMMPQHHARVSRLAELHRSMMAQMGM